ncbi:sigma-70 family RNA polymerase sigma factor [Nocardioides massiliensis]|uniref:RNA polymerase sigma-70 factor (ECF subfamily) n=1 Tax=Nocardioides massiliensis TaxID=1325935 RepID=A0ABT9NIV3_9ACTN|nr:sigma-70 family RNA polymerase sigma factor [Nocardioides massiliensis]MDP9820332.1 RNA polymerase sigma-70 factor (ECF subfamily) [Nocardioides massiliensis]
MTTYDEGGLGATDRTAAFETERPRLERLAARVLGDPAEAEDVVQQAWLRLHGTDADITNLPAWLTTVTTRLCLDRLRAKVPVPEEVDERLEGEVLAAGEASDPADELALADTVGIALQAVLDRLSPGERVAFVLHDSFGFDFPTIAGILDTTPAAARKLASRARSKIVQPAPEDGLANWEVVDAFLAAARGGDFDRLLGLLAPDVVVTGDVFAIAMGTPERIAGASEVAGFFNGAAKAALPVFVGEHPGAAWMQHGEARVAFDFRVVDGRVASVDFRADPDVLAQVRSRRDGEARGRPASA